MKQIKSKIISLFPFVVSILGLITALYLQSRAFTFGFVFAIVLVYILSQKKPFKFIIIGIAGLFALLMAMTFLFKTGSSEGRLLIYKISFGIFKDNWFAGIGLGNFKQLYLPQQANYFALGNYTKKELLLADNTHYAFNDYWQFIIETGLVGIIVIIIAFYVLYRIIRRSLYTKSHLVIKFNVLSILMAILTAAFFTHVFERAIFQVTIILCLSVLCFFNFKKSTLSIALFFVTLCFLSAIGFNSFNAYRINENYKTALNLYIAGFLKDSRTELQKISPIQDNKRAVLYMQILMASNKAKNEKSIIDILKRYPNANSYRLLGDYYKVLGRFIDSESAYVTAINIVPNRFLPRRDLLNLYLLQNRQTKAEEVAKEILSLDIKVNSYQVMQIRAEAIDFLKNRN